MALRTGRLCREIQLHIIATNCSSFMWLTCDQAVLPRQLLSLSPKKKNKKPDRRLPVHFVYFISRNFQQICSSRWTKMRLYPPFFRCFFPKAEAKSSLDLQSRKERCIFIGHYGGVIIHVKSVTERIHKILLRNFLPYLLHNSLQVKKFALLVCRSVYSAWCSRPSSLVGLGFQPVFEQFGS